MKTINIVKFQLKVRARAVTPIILWKFSVWKALVVVVYAKNLHQKLLPVGRGRPLSSAQLHFHFRFEQ